MNYKKSVYTTFAMISQVGISMIVPILLCTYAGVWLEEKFDFPWTVIMIVVGVLAGVRNVIAMVKRMKQITEEDTDEEE
ncbi:MAG: AtpZ/AtpI family protein [Faecalimonas sp.]|nr:AtpZ/AtpI family protein [Faecalimonas sp.]